MKSNKGIEKWFSLLAFLLSCLVPLACIADDSATTMPRTQLEREAREGLLVPLDPLDEDTDAVVDGVVYGYGTKRYRTFFKVNDAALFEAVGIKAPQGTMSWDAFMDMARAVERYNQQTGENVYLLETLDQRFPEGCALLAKGDVRAQWDAVKPLVCEAGQEENRALLTECSVSIESVGSSDYVAGIESEGVVYPLAEPEMRYVAIRRDEETSEEDPEKLLFEAREAQPAQTGIIPEEMTYETFLLEWNLSVPVPSEANFELFKQAYDAPQPGAVRA